MQEQHNSTSAQTQEPKNDPTGFVQESNDAGEEDLVDLQPDVIEEKTLISRILGPKVIILTFLSLIFISRNIYNLLVIKPQQEEQRQKFMNSTNTQSGQKVIEIDFWKETLQLYDKLSGYIIMTVILTAIYFILVRLNTKQIEKKLRKDAERQAEEGKENERQREVNVEKKDRMWEEEKVDSVKQESLKSKKQ